VTCKLEKLVPSVHELTDVVQAALPAQISALEEFSNESLRSLSRRTI
jgi:hypothetical protein